MTMLPRPGRALSVRSICRPPYPVLCHLAFQCAAFILLSLPPFRRHPVLRSRPVLHLVISLVRISCLVYPVIGKLLQDAVSLPRFRIQVPHLFQGHGPSLRFRIDEIPRAGIPLLPSTFLRIGLARLFYEIHRKPFVAPCFVQVHILGSPGSSCCPPAVTDNVLCGYAAVIYPIDDHVVVDALTLVLRDQDVLVFLPPLLVFLPDELVKPLHYPSRLLRVRSSLRVIGEDGVQVALASLISSGVFFSGFFTRSPAADDLYLLGMYLMVSMVGPHLYVRISYFMSKVNPLNRARKRHSNRFFSPDPLLTFSQFVKYNKCVYRYFTLGPAVPLQQVYFCSACPCHAPRATAMVSRTAAPAAVILI